MIPIHYKTEAQGKRFVGSINHGGVFLCKRKFDTQVMHVKYPYNLKPAVFLNKEIIKLVASKGGKTIQFIIVYGPEKESEIYTVSISDFVNKEKNILLKKNYTNFQEQGFDSYTQVGYYLSDMVKIK